MRKVSPATAISLVALFFSLTGAGFAASRYIITSTHQIKPSVLRALKGNRGPEGVPGPQGPSGAARVPGTMIRVTGPIQVAEPSPPESATPVISAADCPQGTELLSGGYWADRPTNPMSNAPNETNGWVVQVMQTSAPTEFYAVAICQPSS